MKASLIIIFIFISLVGYAQDSTKTYDPCQDPQLLRLQKKDSLSDSEMNMYVELRKLCDDKNKSDLGPARQKSKSDTQVQQEQERKEAVKDAQTTAYSAMTIYYILAGISLIVSLIYLLSI